jgi:hypothetical protein
LGNGQKKGATLNKQLELQNKVCKVMQNWRNRKQTQKVSIWKPNKSLGVIKFLCIINEAKTVTEKFIQIIQGGV